MRIHFPALIRGIAGQPGAVRKDPSFGTGRTKRTRHAKWALISGCVIFLSLQLALGWGSEWYPRIRDPFYGDKLVKLQRRLASKDGPLILMLGSSRTGLAFHGKRIEERIHNTTGQNCIAFNFGIPASGPVTHWVYYRRMQNVGVHPKLLVLEILPTMLANHAGPPQEHHWLTGERLTRSDVEIVTRLGFPEEATWQAWQKATWNPWYTLRFHLLARVVQSWIPWQYRSDWSRSADECGWGRIERTTITDQERRAATERARLEYAALLSQLQIGGPAVQALRELLADCHSKQIRVQLVLMPLSPEFRSWYPATVEQNVLKFVENLGTEYHCEVLDARNWLDEKQFTDGHHMLVSGSEAFSDRLADSVLAPFVNRWTNGENQP